MSSGDKTKLNGIATGANKYTHPTSSGNKHIPSGGSSGQILRWSADGTAVWGADNNTTYSPMTGATADAAGTSGLVPAPAAGKQGQFLRGDGTWAMPALVKTANGKVVSLNDSTAYKLQGLKLYGKSVQDGVPTPEAPVEIQSAGSEGNITVTLSDGGDKVQTLTYPTPNGLPGIPVDSGGNYTDVDGQQWICDEVDFGRGKYVQRVKKEELTGTPNFNVTVDIDKERFRWNSCLTNIYKDGSNSSLSNFASFLRWSTGSSNHPIFAVSGKDVYFKPTASTTKEEVNRLFSQMIASENPPYILGQLQTPIETILSPDKISVYTTLTSYKPCTTITTDSDPAAGIEVKYVADTGVDVLLAEKQDKLLGETTQLAGFDEDGNLIAREVLPDDIGAIAEPEEGETGQYLQKTDTGASWSDGPDLSDYAKS